MGYAKPALVVLGIAAICLADPKFRARISGQNLPSFESSIAQPAARYASAKVVMYSLTTCPHCKVLRAELQRMGIPFTEEFLDVSESAAREFSDLLRAHRVEGGVGTPSLMVNGTLMLNNPGLPNILLELHKGSA